MRKFILPYESWRKWKLLGNKDKDISDLWIMLWKNLNRVSKELDNAENN